MTAQAFFDAARQHKRALTGEGLSQADVDALNGVIGAWKPAVPASGRKASQKGIDLIHSFETLKLTSYRDPGSANGLPITNGWGTTRDEDGGAINLGTVWTREKADRLFARDLAKDEKAVSDLLGTAPTTIGQFDALVSFAYNVGAGEGGLKTSTLLRMHKAGDYAGAAGQFARWNKNDGRVMAGLTRRRAAEAAMYRGQA